MRYKCIISYDGTNFHGFQTQLNKRTVQEELEKARERERIRQEKLKIDVEKREYQQYLRLKEKFENKEVSK